MYSWSVLLFGGYISMWTTGIERNLTYKHSIGNKYPSYSHAILKTFLTNCFVALNENLGSPRSPIKGKIQEWHIALVAKIESKTAPGVRMDPTQLD